MTRIDRLALLLSLCAILAAAFFGERVFESFPHIEDEYTYIWQAQAVAGGNAILPSPACPGCFAIPFVVDHNGQRFGKYPLGYPVVLAIGLKLEARHLVNPILGGFGLWLMYRLIKRVLDEKTALLASFLTLISPFFLMNSSNLLSHAWSLVLSAGLANAWLDAFSPSYRRPWLASAAAALCLGGLALTRPLTALGVGLPFGLHGLFILLKGQPAQRARVVGIGLAAVLLASLHFLWQYALTGDPFLNPYTLWWPKDTIGFGEQVGYQAGGYQLKDVFINLAASLGAGMSDFFGWPYLSWLFLPFGFVAIRRNQPALLVSAVFLSLVLTYTLYWSGSWLYGPRYYYEGFFSLSLLSAAGIRWLAGRPAPQTNQRRFWLTVSAVFILTAVNLFYTLPTRAASLTNLYGASRSDLVVFSTPQARAATPALVIVHAENWNDYHPLLEMNDAYLNTPFLIAYSQGEAGNQLLAAQYSLRTILHYYPDTPDRFYATPR